MTTRSRGVECETCWRWFHIACQNIPLDQYSNITEVVWNCSYCESEKDTDSQVAMAQVFDRYVDDIVRTVKGDPQLLLQQANKLHTNLQFTLETMDATKGLPFLDMRVRTDDRGTTTCEWYQKPSETGVILNFRSCAPMRWKRNLIQGTINWIFNCTSDWKAFDEALQRCEDIWEANQYPKKYCAKIVNDTITELLHREP